MANRGHLRIIKQGADAWNEWRSKHPNIKPNLSGAKLAYADLLDVNLNNADLRETVFHDSNLTDANLGGADLSGANLFRASLIQSNLTDARLHYTNLLFTHLNGAILTNADFRKAIVGWTTFGDVDLRLARKLETIQHGGPSTIGINTIYRSKGDMPGLFLRGAGVPEDFITYVGSFTQKAFEFYSCFISYSCRDSAFAERLYADLQNRGIRCWFAPEDLRIGDKTRVAIHESIRKHDKLLLVLSKASLASDWVEKEVETAMEKERREKRAVLFPIRLDNAVMSIEAGWPADIRRTRNVGDFRGWKDYDVYQAAFGRLMRDLKADHTTTTL